MPDWFVCLSHLSGPHNNIVDGSLRVAMLTMGSNDVSLDQRPAPSDMRGRNMPLEGTGELWFEDIDDHASRVGRSQ